MWFYFTSLYSLLQWNRKVPITKVILKVINSILWPMKNGVQLEYVQKNVWFCFISIVSLYFSHKTETISLCKFVFTFAMKWKSANYKSHWNIEVFCWPMKNDVSDLNMSYEKMSDFVSFPLFGFILVIKLRSFYFDVR